MYLRATAYGIDEPLGAGLRMRRLLQLGGGATINIISSPQARNMALVGGAGPVRPADDAVQAIADKVTLCLLSTGKCESTAL